MRQITPLPRILIAVFLLAASSQSSVANSGGVSHRQGEEGSTRGAHTRLHKRHISTNSSTTDDLWSSSEELMPSLEGVGGGASRWLSHKESQMLLKKEGGDRGLPVDCCPSIMEIIQPLGGINREGMLVRLFRDINITQSFFELSCRTGVEGKPCRFMDRHLHNQSRCVQKYSYSYALVEDTVKTGQGQYRRVNSGPVRPDMWMLDHIQVRSGCACEVLPRTKRRKSKMKRGKD
ncbi:uncharacterized protein LOC111059872 [Nilaparvata lugens]|uniref:uncharacterized protein LOC111059872 n=1 Tax=Nilaparvata lugens TaxID=108931 RepID=UPI00193EB47A|nr:uncharacterized protein LOC111059872 [Nilaparvata lugens]XP_039291313.1 uncharacterized protein LOC111059872 [Nilaparvata lugens]XP_039291314.1 uncharacterized protein LOC111059872 [Nilaparvata lugens]